MTTTTLHTPTGLVTHDLEGHDNVYAKETPMEMVGPDAGWGFHERAEKLNGQSDARLYCCHRYRAHQRRRAAPYHRSLNRIKPIQASTQ